MLPTFCLRLALGMIAPLMILPAAVVPPRFFRVQFLSVLGLFVVVGLFPGDNTWLAFWVAYGVAATLALLGSIVWHTEEAPFGRAFFYLTALAAVALVILNGWQKHEGTYLPWLLLDDLLAAGVLGGAVSAMLMGHSYLVAPSMSMTPLNRLLGWLFAALLGRVVLACLGLSWWWTRQGMTSTLEMETVVWLWARWLLGLTIPMGLVWMAWETARIRSTQSATGILYVVTIVCFLGELLSQLLTDKLGMPM